MKYYKNLNFSDYAENLCKYFDHSRDATKLSKCYLRNVLNGLNNNPFVPDDVSVRSTVIDQIYQRSVEVDKVISEKTTEVEVNYHYGEHLACMWRDDVENKINWHLGMVHEYENGESYHT